MGGGRRERAPGTKAPRGDLRPARSLGKPVEVAGSAQVSSVGEVAVASLVLSARHDVTPHPGDAGRSS